jgi:hypothetical protein
MTANADVATVLGSIPASSNTVKSEERQDEAVLNTVHTVDEEKSKNLPVRITIDSYWAIK